MLPDEIKKMRVYAMMDLTLEQEPRTYILQLAREVTYLRAELVEIGKDKHLADCQRYQTEYQAILCHCHQIMALQALAPEVRD